VTELLPNQPERLNAIDEEVATQLRDGLVSVGRARECRCLGINGIGRGFGSG
jgi:enoyl-CoA hydratase/carnithine racemase